MRDVVQSLSCGSTSGATVAHLLEFYRSYTTSLSDLLPKILLFLLPTC